MGFTVLPDKSDSLTRPGSMLNYLTPSDSLTCLLRGLATRIFVRKLTRYVFCTSRSFYGSDGLFIDVDIFSPCILQMALAGAMTMPAQMQRPSVAKVRSIASPRP
jgi:hypothetical protein